MTPVNFEFMLTHGKKVAILSMRRVVHALPPVGCVVRFAAEEGISKVESIDLHVYGIESQYTVMLNNIDLTDDFDTYEKAEAIFTSKGWEVV